MRFIIKPSVYLVSTTRLLTENLDHYLDDNGFSNWSTNSCSDGETIVEVAGRVCYQSFKGGREHKDYIEHIIESGHGSVLEHTHWGFIITGVSRSLTHELIRHRAGFGFSELSQRYVDMEDTDFVVPARLCNGIILGNYTDSKYIDSSLVSYITSNYPQYNYIDELKLFTDNCKEVSRKYRDLYDNLLVKLCVKEYENMHGHKESISNFVTWLQKEAPLSVRTKVRKEARQTARSVLPESASTQIYISGNCRAYRNLIEQRGSTQADGEIRRLINYLYEELTKQTPFLFADYTKVPLSDGTYSLVTRYRKV